MTRETELRRQAAERSRENGYRTERPGIFAIGPNGCDHVLDAEGACVKCAQQIVSGLCAQRR